MRTFLLGFAYFLVFTTPIQVIFLIWVLWVIAATDFTFSSLTGLIFWEEYLTLLLFFKQWLYTWFWNDFLNFIFGLPIIIMISFKLIVNTILGIWLLRVARAMKP